MFGAVPQCVTNKLDEVEGISAFGSADCSFVVSSLVVGGILIDLGITTLLSTIDSGGDLRDDAIGDRTKSFYISPVLLSGWPFD